VGAPGPVPMWPMPKSWPASDRFQHVHRCLPNDVVIRLCLQTIQHKMAEMKTEICVGRAFVDNVNKIHNDTKLDSVMASMAKYWCVIERSVSFRCVVVTKNVGRLLQKK
jgi:hypothetical protein